MKFRFDINALRGIAVIGVIFFHYKVPYFSGGFSGVDIFFVISGYLMSKIIISGIDKGGFSVVDFYGKRVKRIVPALLFLVVILTVSCFFFYFPAGYQINERNAASSVLFLSNILYWKSSNYFDPLSDTNLFLHTWSLSVEWQFYLIYPIVLLLAAKIFKRKSIYLLYFFIFTIVFFVFSIVFTKLYSTASFYVLPSRAWEMLVGGLAFLAENKIKNRLLNKFTAIIGYITLFLCFTLLKSEMAWPGIFTLLPVFATFLVIISSYNDFAVLKYEGVQLVGKGSYSLYLWHWPLLVIIQYFGIELNLVSTILLLIAALLFAYISYKYIESIRFERSKRLVITAACLATITAILAFVNVNSIVFKPVSVAIEGYTKNHVRERSKQFSSGVCFISSRTAGLKALNKLYCLSIEKDKKNILLLGDSHAAQFSQSLTEALSNQNIHLIQATASGCLPLVKKNGTLKCSEVMNYVFKDFIASNASRIDGIIICANWINDSRSEYNGLLKDINNTIAYLTKFKIPIIILGQNKTYLFPYPSIAAKELEYNIKVSNKYLNKNSDVMNGFLSKNLAPYYVDIYNYDTFPKVSSTNVPYMLDMNHFTKYGADSTIAKVLSNPIAMNFFRGKE